jgi:hypothetical protein
VFETVPVELTQALRRLPAGMKTPDLRHLAAGGLVTAHYLNSEAPLRASGMLPAGEVGPEDAARLVQIGDLLFALRAQPGFEALCRHLSDAPLSTILFELTTAAMLVRHGFTIHARPAEPLSRYEYGLRAVRGDIAVNVATIALEGGRFRRAEVLEALWRKRKRLPDDLPAVLFCLYPASWGKDAWDLDFELRAIARTVLREARRINYLLFAEERFTPVEGGGIVSLAGFAARNMTARLAASGLDAAMMDGVEADPGKPVVTAPRRLDRETFGYGDFDQWVNWAVAN